MLLAWPTEDCLLDTCRKMSTGFSQSRVFVSLSLRRRRGKTVDVPDGGKTGSWGALKLVPVEKLQTIVLLKGDLTKNLPGKNYRTLLRTVIENKCGASLTILKHNPISVLLDQAGPLVCFGCWLGCRCCVFHPGRPEAEGGLDPCRPHVIDAYNITCMDSCPFQLPSWNPLFSVLVLSATSRCPLRDVVMETQCGHKIVECFFIIWDFFLSKPFCPLSLH